VETATLTSRLEASVAQPRFAAWTVGAFAFLALFLSAAGLYGTLSYSVSQRTREIGVRSALGATRGDIVRLVFRQGLLVVVIGLGLGLTAAALGSRVMSSLLFGVTPRDPVAFLLAPLLLFLAASIACLVPAWRGASIQPTEALRCE
jgi:ABC-type antimicrobial peptide transport system permease subunit